MHYKLAIDNNGELETLFICGKDFVTYCRNPLKPMPPSPTAWLDWKISKWQLRKDNFYWKYWMCGYGPAYWIDRIQRRFNLYARL